MIYKKFRYYYIRTNANACEDDDHAMDRMTMLNYMQLWYNQIIHTGGQDDAFMLKVLNVLETSNNGYFLLVMKKRDA